MFKNIFNSKKNVKNVKDVDHDNKHIVEKISNMNLSDMRTYVRNAIKDFEVTEFGLEELMRKLTHIDENTGHYYINYDDMASKKKKAFDVVILVAQNKKITPVLIDQIQNFIALYKEMIEGYDTEFKEIYASRFHDAVTLAIANVNELTELQYKMNVLGE